MLCCYTEMNVELPIFNPLLKAGSRDLETSSTCIHTALYSIAHAFILLS